MVENLGREIGDNIIAAGAAGNLAGMAPPLPEGESARDRGIALARDVAKTAGTPRGETPTREDWAGYYRARIESAERNLSPREAMQVVAGLERDRQAGMGAAVALSLAAAAAGDASGVARALTMADAYLPDGFRTTFEPAEGGIVMTRTPEGGGGQPQRIAMTMEQVTAFATRTMNPQWALQHELSVRQQTARETNDRDTLALRREEMAANRAERGAAAGERRTALSEARQRETAGATYIRATDDLQEAQRDLAALPSDAPAERRAEAEAAVTTARTAMRAARASAPSAALLAVDRGEAGRERDATTQRGQDIRNDTTRFGIDEQGRRVELRTIAEDRRAEAAGRLRVQLQRERLDAAAARMTPDQRRSLAEAVDTFGATHTPRGQTEPSPEAQWAIQNAGDFAAANPRQPPSVVLDILRRARGTNPTVRVDLASGTLVDSRTGVRIQMPEGMKEELARARTATPAPGTVASRDPGGATATPPRSSSGRTGASPRSEASPPAEAPPAPRPSALGASTRRPTAATPGLAPGEPEPRETPGMQSALAALGREAYPTNPQIVGPIARRYGVSEENLLRQYNASRPARSRPVPSRSNGG